MFQSPAFCLLCYCQLISFFSPRSLNLLSPVLTALTEAYKKYE